MEKDLHAVVLSFSSLSSSSGAVISAPWATFWAFFQLAKFSVFKLILKSVRTAKLAKLPAQWGLTRLKKLKKLKAKHVMNKIVFTTNKEKNIFAALSKMFMLQVRQLPVIDEKKKVIGIIFRGDIFDFLLRNYLLNALKNKEL